MIVCHCETVSDRTVAALAAQGCHSIERISAACGAGSDCGGCHDVIEDIIEESVTPVAIGGVAA